MRCAAAARLRLVDAVAGNLVAVESRMNGAFIDCYTGAAPADPDGAATGTLLATFTLNASDAFAAASDDGTRADAIANAIAATTWAANGTVGYARLRLSDNTAYGLLTTGVTGSGAEVELSSLTATAGNPVQVNAARFRKTES